jgi:hypothetical protein
MSNKYDIYLVQRRITRNYRLKQVVDDDEEDDEEDDDANANTEVNADNQENEEEEEEEEGEETNHNLSQSNDSKQEGKHVSISTEINDSRPRTRRAVAEASDKSNDQNIDNVDLYTRIKRTRNKNQAKPNS